MSTTESSLRATAVGRTTMTENDKQSFSLCDFLTEYFQDSAESIALLVDENSYLMDFYQFFSQDCPGIKCQNVASEKLDTLTNKFSMLENCLAFKAADFDLVVSVVFATEEIKTKFEKDFDNFQREFKARLLQSIKHELHLKRVQFTDFQKLNELHQMTEKYRNFVEISRGIMHSFNNHLALIMGRAQLLSMFSGEVIEKKAAQKGLDIILKATNAASDQISILQSYARMDDDEKQIQVPIGELIDEIMDLSMPRWKGMGHGAVTFEYNIDPELTFAGYRRKIKEVLINVLMNAVETEKEKGGVIEIKARQDHSQLVVSVKDHGTGIPDSDLEKVFEPLYTTKEKSTGLGLYLAREFLKENQGDIDLISTFGEGTTVNIYLPLN